MPPWLRCVRGLLGCGSAGTDGLCKLRGVSNDEVASWAEYSRICRRDNVSRGNIGSLLPAVGNPDSVDMNCLATRSTTGNAELGRRSEDGPGDFDRAEPKPPATITARPGGVFLTRALSVFSTH